MSMRTSSQSPGLRVSNRRRLEGWERNRRGRRPRASLCLPRPLPCRRRGDERCQSEPRVSRALYRGESRRLLLLSVVGEAGDEVEAGAGHEVEAGTGHEVDGAEEGEEGRKMWTRWMSR
jgi:hypothetical protein